MTFVVRIMTFVVITQAQAQEKAQVQIRTKVDYNAKGGFKLNWQDLTIGKPFEPCTKR